VAATVLCPAYALPIYGRKRDIAMQKSVTNELAVLRARKALLDQMIRCLQEYAKKRFAIS
jgi:hypothetical protein